MQKRKFDELISHFNRKVSDMSIDQKYKMELLGMISAIGFAHEKELGTNLAEVGTDCISRQAAIDAIEEYADRLQMVDWKENPGVPYKAYALNWCINTIRDLPSAQPEIIRCNSCKHWTQSTGKMKGYGLGRCDFHDVDLVTCNGFCYWAERRTDG